ncbi:MAG: hypothetical protein M2R45_04634 [Verrucomicrobia subdivision 3 bacterium]|nr:hypothetical protein [Limisphaerales bacterium]MCS1417126.1 hypothetical protein [Limisphaerales bacterium]
MADDLQGIRNIFAGSYRRTDGTWDDGPGLKAIFNHLDEAATSRLARTIESARKTAPEIPAPFNQAILGDADAPGRRTILRCVQRLEETADILDALEQRLTAALNPPSSP